MPFTQTTPKGHRMLVTPKRLTLGLVAAALFAAPGRADAQLEAGAWTVSPRAGYITWMREAGFENTAAVGLDAMYNVTSALAIGPSLNVTRPNTRGEDFVAAMRFGVATAGDTTLYFRVVQPVTVLNAALNATLRLPLGAISPYVTGGGGVYTLFLNPGVNRRASTFSGPTANVGGGIDVPLGRRAGILLDVRDQIFMKYDRDKLTPTEARFTERRFTTEFPPPPEKKETLHNLTFSIGFSFSPRGSEPEGAAAPADTPAPTPTPPTQQQTPPGDAR